MNKRVNKKTAKSKLFLQFYLVTLSISVVILAIIGFAYVTSLQQICANSITCIKDLSGRVDPTATTGTFLGKEVTVPSQFAASNEPFAPSVLGDSTGSNKRIYIDLTNQRIYAKEGDVVIYDFLISSGKWGKTPTGDFRIWIKLRSTRMAGGNPAIGTYYNLPNVPYTMYFYNESIPKSRGYGIHGAYWHNNFGHPMSHGCINMREEDVAKIYAWANPVSTKFTTYATEEDPGTPITIYGVAANQ